MRFTKRVEKWAAAQRRRLRSLRTKYLTDCRQNLAVLAIMKNESLNVDEWIDHYIWQGADHIFIIDNGSTDDTYQKILLSHHKDKITLLSYPEKHVQSAHYRKAVRSQRIRSRFRWLFIADADEFCFAKKHRTLPEALAEFDWYDVIYVQWTYFGCKDQTDHPKSLRAEQVYRHDTLGSHFNSKWFAKTKVIRGKALSIHKVRGADSARTITANDVFQLNHYQTQSYEFWTKVKMTRGDAALSHFEEGRSMAIFDEYNAKAVKLETTLSDRVKSENQNATGE